MRTPSRSLDEWMSIINECRQSGLSDAAWCEQNGISASSFYNAATRLRKKACSIPDPVKNTEMHDFTATKQEVVEVKITPELKSMESVPFPEPTPMYLDNSHTIEIATGEFVIRLSNSADPVLLRTILNSLR